MATKKRFIDRLGLFTVALGLGLQAPSSGWALTPEVKKLVEWETTANNIALRSPKPFPLKHYEIPLKLLKQNFAANLDPQVRDALIFKKNGEEYVRWVINPEDSKWHPKVARFLRSKGLDATPKTYLIGHLTASRSIIAEDPNNGAQFSIKVSTNKTGGAWRDKHQPIDDADQIRMANDFITPVMDKFKMENLIIMDEPLELGIEAINQALIVRSLGELTKGGRYYLPGFSAVHEKVGVEIAKINGSNNPAEFWNTHYNQPLARAYAEFVAHFGIYYDSPHSQNFLIELDSQLKPTGRIVLRDFGDAYVNLEYFKAINRLDFIKKWEQGNIESGSMGIAIGLMHGNNPPSWLKESHYQRWGSDFYAAFEKRFAELTGIPLKELQAGWHSGGNMSYFQKSYSTKGPGFVEFLAIAECMQGVLQTSRGTPCPDFITKRLKPGANINAGVSQGQANGNAAQDINDKSSATSRSRRCEEVLELRL